MSARDGRLPLLREAISVADAKERDLIVRRIRRIRAGAVLDKCTYEHWNQQHPEEKPIDTSFWDQLIAWCDGKGPFPSGEGMS